ncbi:MAG TPA: threonine synthase, partial [Limnochordia bacterium]
MRAATYQTGLVCSACGRLHDAQVLQTVCIACGKPLFAQYVLDRVAAAWRREDLASRPQTLWRYHELLPLSVAEAVSLGETMTPLLACRALAERLRLKHLWIKDESRL